MSDYLRTGFGLPMLKMQGDIVRYDGEPFTDAQKSAIRAGIEKRNKRNARRRARYVERKSAQ